MADPARGPSDTSDERAEAVRVLSQALDQAGDVLARVHPDDLDRPTPCRDWTVGQLVSHLLTDPPNFMAMQSGGQPDWTPPDGHPTDWVTRFRASADDLRHLWHRLGDGEAVMPPDFQTAEVATHTWDLARALGIDTGVLDREVAERGLAFVEANLTEENRGPAFGPPRPAPEGAGPYERLAAFTGRELTDD